MTSNTQLKSTELKELREQLHHEQNGICPICNKEKTSDEMVVDHQHQKGIKGSGLIRGAICRTCNVFLAKSENNCKRFKISLEELPDTLRRIADFLERTHLPLIHPTEKPKAQPVSKRNYNKLKKEYLKSERKKKFPEYPKSSKLTKDLGLLFEEFGIEPFN